MAFNDAVRFRVLLPALPFLVAAFWVTAAATPAPAAAASINPKVVVIAGPVGSFNSHYRADADAIAATARKYTSNVVLLKTPHAPWSRVKPALQGASIVVYLGHGNGWPSVYAPYQPYTKDGLGLDPETGADGTAHVYYGEYYLANEVRLAPNAIVLLHHLCYASGNTSGSEPIGGLSKSEERVDNYGAGFIAAGARAVIADVAHPHTKYISALFGPSQTIDHLFHVYPTYHGHDIRFSSIRSPGFRAILDPTTSHGPWYRSMIGQPGLTTAQVTRTRYTPTGTAPAAFVVPGAAEVTATDGVGIYAAADLTGDPVATLPMGTRLRFTAAAAPLADGTRVFAASTLDGASVGYVAATGISPRDSSAPRLWTLDKPYSPASADGTYPFAVRYRASETVSADVVVRNAAGVAVRTLSATSDWTTIGWDLRTDSGTVVPNGTYRWSLTASDGWGNAPAVAASGSVTIDGTDPRSTATLTGTQGLNGWLVSPATVTVGASHTGSGVASRRYRIDGGSTKSVSGSIKVAGSAAHSFVYYAIDKAGNRETSHTITIKVDTTRPVTTPTLSGPAGTNGWWTGGVDVSLAATDKGAGVAGIKAGVDGASLATVAGPLAIRGDGTHSIRYGATDRAGNVESTRTLEIKIDSTRPTTGQATITGTPGTAGWYRSPVSLGLSGADGLSGLAGYRYRVDAGTTKFTSASSITVSSSGDHTVTYAAVDRAGNADASQSVGFRLDATVPVTAATVAGPAGDTAGTWRGPVSVSLAATDDASGVTGVMASIDGAPMAAVGGPIALSSEGVHTIRFFATDAAGNVEATKTLALRIDTVVPGLSAVTPAVGTVSPNGDGVHETASVQFSMSEAGTVRVIVADASGLPIRSFVVTAPAGSGVMTWNGRTDGGAIAPDGVYTVTLRPRDVAGNVGQSAGATLVVYTGFRGGAASPSLFYPQDGDTYARSTMVRFTLAAAADVRLDVVAAGGSVARTIATRLAAGAASISWNGTTTAGSYAPQGVYTLRLTVGNGPVSETKAFTVRAQAFKIVSSRVPAVRGARLTVTVATAEPLAATPHLTVRQPGISAYSVSLTKVSAGVYRATFTVRASATGTMSLTASGRDKAGHSQSTVLRLALQ